MSHHFSFHFVETVLASLCEKTSWAVSQPICLSTCLSVCLPACLSVGLSVFLSVCLSACFGPSGYFRILRIWPLFCVTFVILASCGARIPHSALRIAHCGYEIFRDVILHLDRHRLHRLSRRPIGWSNNPPRYLTILPKLSVFQNSPYFYLVRTWS